MHSFDGPTAEIDLSRIKANYNSLRARFTGAECGAVVKANAYGLGVDTVAPALKEAGCHTFFVATLEEGIQLRSILPDDKIAIFQGVGPGEALAFVNHRLIPVLNSPQQIERWMEVARNEADRPSILHIDTAMARLGLTETEYARMDEAVIETCQIRLLMSHLACSSDPQDERNHEQLERFIRVCERFPQLPTSLANSGGILLGEAWHDDLARPGCALYGINPGAYATDSVNPVVRLSAPVIQVRTLDREQPVGYGASQTLPKDARLATVAMGYADGVHRLLSHTLTGYIGGTKVPLVGRVTMDLLTFDLSALPEQMMSDTMRIEIMNEKQTVNDVAQAAQTIGYELLSRMGTRVKRVYTEWAV